MSDSPPAPAPRWYRTRNGKFLLVALGLFGVYLLTEYGAQAAQVLPWLLFAACPLMHVFMHRGHGGHGGHAGHGSGGQDDAPPGPKQG